MSYSIHYGLIRAYNTELTSQAAGSSQLMIKIVEQVNMNGVITKTTIGYIALQEVLNAASASIATELPTLHAKNPVFVAKEYIIPLSN